MSQIDELEARVSSLETWRPKINLHTGYVEDPPPDGELHEPDFIAKIASNTAGDCYAFNPLIYKDGKFYTFVNDGGLIRMGVSTDGVTGWTYTPTNAPYGSIMFVDGLWRASAHKWYNGQVTSYYYGSQNGIYWEAMSADWSQTSGEDRNLLKISAKWMNFVRVQPKPRTIGYCESLNFTQWTRITEILRPDVGDGALKQFYHMSVIHTPQGYFGLLNVYRIGNSGQDVEQPPPYTELEHTVDLQLVWSEDGMSWTRLNDRKIFILRKNGVKQLFGWWGVQGDKVKIITAESKRRHTTWEDMYNRTGNYFESGLYELSLTELYKYKTASNLTMY